MQWVVFERCDDCNWVARHVADSREELFEAPGKWALEDLTMFRVIHVGGIQAGDLVTLRSDGNIGAVVQVMSATARPRPAP
jgi:hypothetical protein